MKKVVLIPTEKTGKTNIRILEFVLDSIYNQSSQIDEIIIVKNYTRNQKLQLNNNTQSKNKITELFLEKKLKYEAASVLNVGLEFIYKKFHADKKINLIKIDDDCVLEKNYVKKMNPRNELEINTLTGQLWVRVHENKTLNNTKTKKEYFIDKIKKVISHPIKSVKTIINILKRKYETLFNIRDVKLRIDNVQDSLIPDNRAGGLISFIWDMKRMPDLRHDENYDGNWGFEDSDLMANLVSKGYYYNKIDNIYVKHYKTDWKKELHDPETANLKYVDNPNEKYFINKWKR